MISMGGYSVVVGEGHESCTHSKVWLSPLNLPDCAALSDENGRMSCFNIYIKFTFIHLADAFIQSDLQMRTKEAVKLTVGPGL